MNGNYSNDGENMPRKLIVECECQCVLEGFAKVTTEDAECCSYDDIYEYDFTQCDFKKDYEDTFLTPRQLITRLYNIELERVCNGTTDADTNLAMKSCEVWMECGTENISVNMC